MNINPSLDAHGSAYSSPQSDTSKATGKAPAPSFSNSWAAVFRRALVPMRQAANNCPPVMRRRSVRITPATFRGRAAHASREHPRHASQIRP